MGSRPQFLRNSGLAAVYLALPAWLTACSRGDAAPAAQRLVQPEVWDDPQPGAHPEIVHLLNRITYGPRPGEVEQVARSGWDAFLDRQLHAAALLRAIYSERQLFEIMVDFWSNHFNIFIGKNQVKWLKTADDRDVIRTHALGKFRDLLLASAKSPAMLVYLDNAENIKPGARRGKIDGGLNENYAREVMELHTVGADGGYTQDDVTTVARALTGWTITRRNADQAGEFQFAPRLHDDDAKQIAFLHLALPAGGGLKDGEALLGALASHPNTAARIAHKLCVTFVADDPPQALVERAAKAYLDSDTDTRATLKAILTSDEFKASAGHKVKLPLRALVSSVRALGADVGDGERLLPLVKVLRDLGQAFFGWQAPNSYPQIGAAWVNTGGMLARWNAAFALAEGRIKNAQVDLHGFISPDLQAAGALVDTLGAALLHMPLPAPARAALIEYTGDDAGESVKLDHAALSRRLPELAGLILASPAFQTH